MMRWRFLLLLLITLGGLPALGDDSPTQGMQTDIEYARIGDVSLTLDAFVPEGDGPFPTCILVHGGGFTKGDKQSYIKPLFEPLSKAGFTWFTINYRLAPEHRWPACLQDVQTAIWWVKQHAEQYNVDPERIALIGESAGGHLVSYAGELSYCQYEVAAVVPFYAPHDLALQVRHRDGLGESLKALLNLTELNDDAWATMFRASPMGWVHRDMPPYLLIHGDQDETVPLEQSIHFQKEMQTRGNRCDLIVVPGGGHGMGGWKKLDSDYQQRMIDWLKSTLADVGNE